MQSRVLTPSGRGKKASTSQASTSIPSSQQLTPSFSSSSAPTSFTTPSLEAYANLFSTANTTPTSATDFYNSLASFMAAAASGGQAGSSYMPPFSPSLSNPMYAASLAGLGMLPSLGGSYGFEDFLGENKDASSQSTSSSSKKKQDTSSSNYNTVSNLSASSNSSTSGSRSNKNNSNGGNSRSKNNDDTQKKRSSKSSKNQSSSSGAFPTPTSSSSLNPLMGDMDMNNMFGGPFNPFMYNPMLFNQLYAQSMAAFNPSSSSSSTPPSMADLQSSFLSSFMPPSFDMPPPISTSKSSDKKKSRSSSKNAPSSSSSSSQVNAKPAHAHSKPATSKAADDIFSIYSEPLKKPERAHSKHSPKPAAVSSVMKMDELYNMPLPSSSSMSSSLDMYNSLFKMPSSFPLDNLFPSTSPSDQPEDLSLSSKKKPTRDDTSKRTSTSGGGIYAADNKERNKSNNADRPSSKQDDSKLPSSYKSPLDKSSAISLPSTSLSSSLPFFMDSSSPLSLFNSSFNFPNLPSYPLKSPFDPPPIPSLSSPSTFNIADYMPTSKPSSSSKKDSKGSSSKSKKENRSLKQAPVTPPSSLMDAESQMLMSQFMMSAADMSKYSMMEEQLRMMSSMDMPPFYLPSSFMPPNLSSLYPNLNPLSSFPPSSTSSSKSPTTSRSESSSKSSRKDSHDKGKQPKQQDYDDFIAGKKMFNEQEKNIKDDNIINNSSQSKLSSAFNIDKLSIPSTSSSPSPFFSPFHPSFSYPSLFSQSYPTLNQEEDSTDKPVIPPSNKTPKSKSKSFASIDSISSKLLARKQGDKDEENTPSYATTSISPAPSKESFQLPDYPNKSPSPPDASPILPQSHILPPSSPPHLSPQESNQAHFSDNKTSPQDTEDIDVEEDEGRNDNDDTEKEDA